MAQNRMNPSTLRRLYDGLPEQGSAHILSIGAMSGCWPGTIYLAQQLGYLRKTAPAMFRATGKLTAEIRRIQRIEADRTKEKILTLS